MTDFDAYIQDMRAWPLVSGERHEKSVKLQYNLKIHVNIRISSKYEK